jgi:hypothetical protein
LQAIPCGHFKYEMLQAAAHASKEAEQAVCWEEYSLEAEDSKSRVGLGVGTILLYDAKLFSHVIKY